MASARPFHETTPDWDTITLVMELSPTAVHVQHVEGEVSAWREGGEGRGGEGRKGKGGEGRGREGRGGEGREGRGWEGREGRGGEGGEGREGRGGNEGWEEEGRGGEGLERKAALNFRTHVHADQLLSMNAMALYYGESKDVIQPNLT